MLDEVAHEYVNLTEPGVRYIASRGLCFIPPNLALCVLELGPEEVTISKVASLLFPLLLRHGSPHFDGALDWLQVIPTARDDDNLVGGVIHTRRDLLPAPAPRLSSFEGRCLLGFLQNQFPGRFASPSASAAGDEDNTSNPQANTPQANANPTPPPQH